MIIFRLIPPWRDLQYLPDASMPYYGTNLSHASRATKQEKMIQLDIMLNFDKTEIASSNIWTSPKLEFYVRVQLLSGTEVIKEM